MTAGDAHARARWARRGDIALRVVAAVPLGYATALCAIAAMWAFAARSGWRAIWTLATVAGIAAAIAWVSIDATGRL
jgi:hypothetical protein